ncbi:MAG: phosphotransferase [Chthoniobacter sp.]|nr:phosphotransferase [Chthoniobacter sp.]
MPARPAEHGWPQGDIPGAVEFREAVPLEISRAVAAVMVPQLPDLADADWRALCADQWPNGRYRASRGDRAWFVRVSELVGEPGREARIIEYLAADGVPVNVPIAIGLLLMWGGRQYRVDARPFLTGARHTDGSSVDLTALGATLAACHRSLRKFPEAATIRTAAQARYERLARVVAFAGVTARLEKWERLAELARWGQENAAWLSTMAAEFDGSFANMSDAQCLHGEIHRANVLFTSAGQAVLLDFEEAVHNFAPPAWDLAYAVQRFCLHDDPSSPVWRARLSALETGYGASFPDLRPMMRQIAWLIAALLIELCVEGREIKPREEYDKFIRLERQAANLVWP